VLILAYWVQTQLGKNGKRGQPSQALAMVDEEEDTMPLLPRSKRRLLGGTPEVEESFSTAPKQRGAQKLIAPKPAPRRVRGATAESEVSIVSVPLPTRTAAKARGKGKTPIVVEEDEDEEAEVDIGLAASRLSGKTGSRSSGRATSSTLEGETTKTRGKTTQMPNATPASTATGRRRMLLPDDDDDGPVSRVILTKLILQALKPGLAKKRRLG
jgi:hypothetical protein